MKDTTLPFYSGFGFEGVVAQKMKAYILERGSRLRIGILFGTKILQKICRNALHLRGYVSAIFLQNFCSVGDLFGSFK